MTPKEIRRARLTLDLTLKEFGELFGKSAQLAWGWEQTGKHNRHFSGDSVLRLKIILKNMD